MIEMSINTVKQTDSIHSRHYPERLPQKKPFEKAVAAMDTNRPNRILVYCHDLFGMGNLSRMLLLCRHIVAANADVRILFIGGSLNISRFEMPQHLDYIKLPSLTRGQTGQISAKHLHPMTSEVLRMRRYMIAIAARAFMPDLLIVDKKPRGAANELDATLHHLRSNKRCRRVLLLRDILDTPKNTVASWRQNGYYKDVEENFDRIFIAGERHIFDVADAYAFPDTLRDRTEYLGYLHITEKPLPRFEVLRSLDLDEHLPLIVVTVGGGEDGFHILDRYLDVVNSGTKDLQSVLVCGPELPLNEFEHLKHRARGNPQIKLLRFTDDMVSLISAADVVVSMAGYNTICKILSFAKPAVVVPRVHPSREQWLRAKLLAKRGYLTVLPPDFSADHLLMAVRNQLLDLSLITVRSANFFDDICSSKRINHMLGSLFQEKTSAYACRN